MIQFISFVLFYARLNYYFTELRPIGMTSQLKEKSFIKLKTAWELLHDLPSAINK